MSLFLKELDLQQDNTILYNVKKAIASMFQRVVPFAMIFPSNNYMLGPCGFEQEFTRHILPEKILSVNV